VTIVKEKNWHDRLAGNEFPLTQIQGVMPQGTRIMVWVILICLASGDFFDEVLRTYPDLTREDIYATLSYAAELARLWEFWR
jgi:Uncharacterized conserved protein, COG2442